MKPLRFHQTYALFIASLGMISGGANAALTNWNSDPDPAVGNENTTGSGDFTWSDNAAWADGSHPVSAAGQSVSLEPRLAVDANITIDGNYTIGEIYARNNGGYATFTGSGTLTFDNGASDSNFYVTRWTTRLSGLRPSIDVNLQLNSTLNIYMGAARQETAGIGHLGQTISGTGALNLNLGGNDTLATRFFKLGTAGANTYSGGTLVQHVGQTTYGSGHGIQNSVQMDVLSTGAFGVGDVTFNATGADYSTAIGTNRGMWIRFQDDEAFATSTTVDVTSANNFAFDLNGTAQVVSGFEVDTVALDVGTYNSSDFTWLFDSGTGGSLTVIPEPSGAALLGLAGLALVLRRRR